MHESDQAHSNPSSNPTFEDVLAARLTRRQVLQGSLGAAVVGLLAGPMAAGRPRVAAASSRLFEFTGVPVSKTDTLIVPPGYVAEVLYAWGDPTSEGPPFKPDASNTVEEQMQQAGMHHDAIQFFPLPMGSSGSTRGLLALNHEYTDDGLLHPDGMQTWTPEKVAKSQAAHGVSVIEVALAGDKWSVVRPSTYARRITARTPMRVAGPAAGHARLTTTDDPNGMRVLGTINNCAGGHTPWGTYLTCEENFNGYFVNPTGDVAGVADADQKARLLEGQKRYGINDKGLGYRWHEHDRRFDASRHPHEAHRFGWVVEIDPFDPQGQPVKQTALGRFKHEGATVTLAADNRAVVYSGDDERNEYIYKFVSEGRYAPADRPANLTLLERGTLYVARFDADGNGEWLELTHGKNGLDQAAGFASQADVLIDARAAADRLGATKMDRPEWIAVHPRTKEIYCALTNNDRRGAEGNPAVDPANPRANNVYGHIVRWREQSGDAAATRFAWDVFLLAGDPQSEDAAKRGTIKGDAFGSPDGLWFDARGALWIQTDVSTRVLNTGDYANIGNNQMLAANPVTGEVRRFLTGPNGCEITGVTETPDGGTMFVNVQHPGETPSERADPARPNAVSSWPDGGRPRSATVVIRKRDGGNIGS